MALTMPTHLLRGHEQPRAQLLYREFNAARDVVCERAFWEKGAAQRGALALESGRPVDEFDVWAFTISWEMDYFNLVDLLRQTGIPPLARTGLGRRMGWAAVAVAHCGRPRRDHEPGAGCALLRRHPHRRGRGSAAPVRGPLPHGPG
ncbi:MAG: hypothetical protein R2838_00820 [Caldilineaceae bacterium]